MADSKILAHQLPSEKVKIQQTESQARSIRTSQIALSILALSALAVGSLLMYYGQIQTFENTVLCSIAVAAAVTGVVLAVLAGVQNSARNKKWTEAERQKNAEVSICEAAAELDKLNPRERKIAVCYIVAQENHAQFANVQTGEIPDDVIISDSFRDHLLTREGVLAQANEPLRNTLVCYIETQENHAQFNNVKTEWISDEVIPSDSFIKYLLTRDEVLTQANDTLLETLVRHIADDGTDAQIESVQLQWVPADIECSSAFADAMLGKEATTGAVRQRMFLYASKEKLVPADMENATLLARQADIDYANCTVKQARYLATQRVVDDVAILKSVLNGASKEERTAIIEHVQRPDILYALLDVAEAEVIELDDVRFSNVIRRMISNNNGSGEQLYNLIQGADNDRIAKEFFKQMASWEYDLLIPFFETQIGSEMQIQHFVEGFKNNSCLWSNSLSLPIRFFLFENEPLDQKCFLDKLLLAELAKDGTAFAKMVFSPDRQRWNQEALIRRGYAEMSSESEEQQAAVAVVKNTLEQNEQMQHDIINFYGENRVPSMLREAFVN